MKTAAIKHSEARKQKNISTTIQQQYALIGTFSHASNTKQQNTAGPAFFLKVSILHAEWQFSESA